MATFNKFNCYVQDLHEGKHDFQTDSLKVALTNTQPAATNSVLADIAEISSGGGYTTGGISVSVTSSTQVNGTYKLVLQDTTFTATGSVQTFRYIVVYNSTAPGGRLICWFDHGNSLTLASNESYFFDFNQSEGLYEMV